MSLFSVIIPTYNRLPLLREALDSVWAQTFTDFEVIVVDDGSTDGTWEYLQGLGARVRAFRQENAGPGAARNRGAAVATGEYLAFLDSDDLWFPWTVAIYASAIAAHGTPSLITGVWVPMTQFQKFGISSPPQFQHYTNLFDACVGTVPPVGGTPSIAVRRKAFCEAGGFCNLPINGEDTDLWLKLGAEPGFVRIQSPPVFAHRVHSSNITLNLERAIAGVRYQMSRERNGAYPGDKAFRRKRIRIIAATARNVSLACIRQRKTAEAWHLYRETFWWNLFLGRIRYLAGLPFLAVASSILPRKVKQ